MKKFVLAAGMVTGLGLLSVVLIGLISCRQSVVTPPEVAPPAKPYFKNVALEAGINFTYRNGEEANAMAILESLGGGGAIFDYNNDGKYDLFLTGGGALETSPSQAEYRGKTVTWNKVTKITGQRCRLFRNDGNWKFTDVSDEVGLPTNWPFTHAAAVSDYNRDGWPDVVVTGFGKVLLFQNDQGKRFTDVSQQAGLTSAYHWPTSAAFADFDGDGWTDLYVCQYTDWSPANHPPCPPYSQKHEDRGIKHDICPPKQFTALRDFLYRNDGKGHFIDVSGAAGIRIVIPEAEKDNRGYLGKGLALLVYDANGDQKPDIYVANDTVVNFMYMNQSTPGQMKFTERGKLMSVAVDDKGQSNGSMGADAADIDGNGLPSLWVTNYARELHALYHMERHGNQNLYSHRSMHSGPGKVGNTFVGWGTMFVDLENNGSMDLLVANGHVVRYPEEDDNLLQYPLLFKNMGREYFRKHKGRDFFQDQRKQGGDYFHKKHRGRGLIVGDLDNNGLPDVVFSHVNKEPVAVLKNIAAEKNHWLGIHLQGKDGRDVTGAKLTLTTDRHTLTRFQKSGGSYASSSDPRVRFGLGTSKATGKLTVYWPSGQPRVEHWEGLAVDAYHDVVQGATKGQ